jgi:hypothetical protein
MALRLVRRASQTICKRQKQQLPHVGEQERLYLGRQKMFAVLMFMAQIDMSMWTYQPVKSYPSAASDEQ